MRIKGTLLGEGGGFDYKNLFYLSIHTLDSASGVTYAKTRVAREVLDAWLQKRVSLDGHKYEEEEVQLTAQENISIFCLIFNFTTGVDFILRNCFCLIYFHTRN